MDKTVDSQLLAIMEKLFSEVIQAVQKTRAEAYAQKAEIERAVSNGSMTAGEAAKRLTALEAQYGINLD